MIKHLPSWLHETLKLFIQYLGVSIASIPAGLVYLLLLRVSLNQNASLVIALCVGFGIAAVVWRFLGKRFLLPAMSESAAYRLVDTNTGVDVQLQGGDAFLASGLHFEGVIVYSTTPSPSAVVLPNNTAFATASSTVLQGVA